MTDRDHELGRLSALVEGLSERLDRMDTGLVGAIQTVRNDLVAHTEREEKRLKCIEQQLSLGRFVLLAAKAIVLTIIAMLAFKFGDVRDLWQWLKQ